VSRIISDSLDPLSKLESGQGHYSSAFLAAIDKALAVKPEERPQSVAEFRTLLDLDARISAPTMEPAPSGMKAAAQAGITIAAANGSPNLIRSKPASYKALYAGAGVLVALIAGAWFFTLKDPAQGPEPETTLEPGVIQPAPLADHALPNSVPGEITAVPASPSKSDISPATVRPTPPVSPAAAPELQQNAAVKPPSGSEGGENKPAKSLAGSAESSKIPSAAAPLADKHDAFPGAIEKIVSTHLVEGRTCLDNKNFECAIAKAETALQLVPDNPVAAALLKDARAAQQKAWEASELE
jgi:hypothetical protein